MSAFERREIGKTGMFVSPLAMGCWPIAGITSINVTEVDSRSTIAAAFDAGINFFDTAYSYGYRGESERMIGEVLHLHRDNVVIATKAGIDWDANHKQIRDARPATIRKHCEESLRRLGVEVIDLYYLHAPDPATPIEVTAAAYRELLDAGKVRAVGLSNATTAQLAAFHAVCPLSAFQPHYNMLQREIETDQLPWCIEHDVSTMVYWPLMKGLLAGKLARDVVFDPKDGRQKYPMFQGEEWQKNQDFLDELRPIAAAVNRSVAQVVLNWTMQRAGITVALCGAKRPDQIVDNAEAMEWKLTPPQVATIDAAIARRGQIISKAAVAPTSPVRVLPTEIFSTMTTSTRLQEQTGGVLTITLNRPERRNALSEQLLTELGAALDTAAANKSVRVIVLASSGPVFSSGHDLGEMTGRSEAEYFTLFARCSHVMQRLRTIPQPVIARVQGLATAAGCQLVAACDLAVAATDAKFATPGVKIGLFCTTPMVPLVRSVPAKTAMEMLLTGQPLSAERALQVGLVNRIVHADQLDSEIKQLTDAICASSPLTVQIGKWAFYDQANLEEEEAYRRAVAVMTDNACRHDAQEGITAFLQKRPANWRGE